MTYFVGIGGEPKENREEYESLEAASSRCVEMALTQAAEEGIDPETVGVYRTAGIVAGACPDGDEGGYWPRVWGEK